MNVEEKMGWPHWAVIVGGVVTVVLLALADKTTLNPTRTSPTPGKPEATDRAGAPLPSEVANEEKGLANAKTAEDSLAALKAALADPTVIQNAERYQRLNATAIAVAEAIAARNPDDLDAQVDAAVFHVASPAPMAGIQKLKQVLEKKPNHYRANVELGKFSMMTAQWDKARERLTTAMNAEPQRWEAPYYLGFLMQSQEKFDEAKKLYEKSLILAPDSSARTQINAQLSALPK